MITGTPVHVSRNDNAIVVLISLGDSSTSLSIECGSAEEAAKCQSLWETLISVAIDAVDEEYDYMED